MFSGGLDSTLAIALLKSLDVQVEAVNYRIGFTSAEQNLEIRKRSSKKMQGENFDPIKVVRNMGIRVHCIDVCQKFLQVISNPKFGYGKNINPCIDCKIFMLKQAKKLMEEWGFDFIATGEVLGQRPMSQRRDTLDLIERESGLRGKLLRPLSAAKMRPTIAEQEGLIDRNKLLGISGRGRKEQIELARQFDITQYQSPAGGCYLTDETYARRMKDLLAHLQGEPLTRKEIFLLAVGRHFRLKKNLKIIVGRDQEENSFLEQYIRDYPSCQLDNIPGPMIIIQGLTDENDKNKIASICLRYSKMKENIEKVKAIWLQADKTYIIEQLEHIPQDYLEQIRI